MDMKQKIIGELDSRIKKLDAHREDQTRSTDNQYGELNQAVSRVIGAALYHELEDVREFVDRL